MTVVPPGGEDEKHIAPPGDSSATAPHGAEIEALPGGETVRTSDTGPAVETQNGIL